MVDVDIDAEVVEGAGQDLWEQMVVTGGGQITIGQKEINKVEESVRSLQSQGFGETEDGFDIDYYVFPSENAIDVILRVNSDMINVPISVERRNRLQKIIGTDGWPKLSQHFFVSQGLIENNYEDIEIYEVEG